MQEKDEWSILRIVGGLKKIENWHVENSREILKSRMAGETARYSLRWNWSKNFLIHAWIILILENQGLDQSRALATCRNSLLIRSYISAYSSSINCSDIPPPCQSWFIRARWICSSPRVAKQFYCWIFELVLYIFSSAANPYT